MSEKNDKIKFSKMSEMTWCPICGEYMRFYDGKTKKDYFFGMKNVFACDECRFFINIHEIDKKKHEILEKENWKMFFRQIEYQLKEIELLRKKITKLKRKRK